MILMLVLGAFLAIGIFLFFRGLALAPREDLLETRLAQFRDQTVTLEEMELNLPFSERFLRPAMERIGAFLNARVGRDRISGIQNKLALAGRPGNLTVNGFISVKVAVGVIMGVGGFLFWSITPAEVPLFGRFLTAHPAGRCDRPRRLFPSRPVVAAKGRSAAEGDPAGAAERPRPADDLGGGRPRLRRRAGARHREVQERLSEEFTQVLNEVRLGRPRLEALDDMGRRWASRSCTASSRR